MSLDEIVVFMMTKSDFNTHYISFEDAGSDSDALPVCGMAMIADHKN